MHITLKNFFLKTEDAFLTQRGLLLDALRTLKNQELIAAAVAMPPPPPPATPASDTLPPRSTLPRIQLPHFSGRYQDWPPFRDLFSSIIGKDSSTSKVEKLHYLKSCLKGEAELLIRDLPTTDENFQRAWKVLTDFYENKRLLTRSYLSQFTSLQKLKNESAVELRKLYHSVRSTVGSLESIGRPIKSGEDLFVHLVVDLLDARSRREWETDLGEKTDPPSYDELLRFLDRRLHTLESLQPMKQEVSHSKTDSTHQTRALHMRKQENKRSRCSLCRKDHYIMFCDVYQEKSATEKKQHIEENNLCINCLGKHKVSECSSKKTCTLCRARHHTTLHDAYKTSEVTKISHVANQSSTRTVVLLATARVRVSDRYGVIHSARALIDQGSESSLISETLAQRLQLTRASTSIAVFGIGGKRTGSARGQVSLRISALKGGPQISVSALVLPRLTLYDGGIRVNVASWPHIDGLELADPDFQAADPIDILLGVDVYASILQSGFRKGLPQEPVAQKTTLGWILSGAVKSASVQHHVHTLQCRVEEDLSAIVRRFWSQEELPEFNIPLTPEDQECEDFFIKTHTRNAEGRYIVRLPVINPLPDLSATRRSALRVLFSMERKIQREPRLQQLYEEFLRQYEDLGHMRLATEIPEKRVCYLPHHGVMREASTTTKLRVVFNGSSSIPSGESLNKCLMIGQNLLPFLADVLLRWRKYRYVFLTDVEKMFRQILVHSDDQDLQRIIWRHPGQKEYSEYRLTTVTYGLACAPFLAMRTLRQLANDEEKQYPDAAAVLRRDVYMDDILTGASTLSEAVDLQRQLIDLCMAGGFPLRKWSANDPALLANIPIDHRMQRDLRSWQPHESHATLGLQWHPSEDSFSFATSKLSMETITKRSVLSLTAKLFDPLGWLAPVIVSAKIAFQSTWLQSLDWDTPLDEVSSRRWLDFQSELPLLEEIRVPRWIGPFEQRGGMEIHGFADASERAYAAVIYLRSKQNKEWTTRLVTSKTKVAPIKQITLPRLELCAASLLARLASYVRKILGFTKAPLHLWSDSTVTLGWIQGHPTRWRTYVANRVSEIQNTVPEALWHHISGKENPADCASRGLSPKELVKHQLWWSGPRWLKDEQSAWPSSKGPNVNEELPETKVKIHVVTADSSSSEEPDELQRFSSLNRLLRVTAWCRRWLKLRVNTIHREANVPYESVLSMIELEDARLLWIRRVQSINFKDELKTIQQERTLSKSNSLIRLNPFIDPQGLLRVGGRLKHAVLAYDERYPIILPSKSIFTRLIIEAYHRRSLHGGVQLTLGMIRQRYWIPRGRAIVKQRILQCVTCVRWRASIPQQLMGNLPPERVTPARPFLHTGVDYAGPIWVRTSKGRGIRAHKAFIIVFVCLSTRAVHLEVVSDYTSEGFLAALRRFTARRGICSTLHSDCGTNFAGADTQLRALFTSSSAEHQAIIGQLATEQIQWRFNPPSAPHFGGIWEAAVKSLKHHLRRVIGDTTLTYEEMSTFLTQVEACLNSRPLQALSDDPEDFAALTPGHFLIGSALNAIPEPTLLEQPTNRLSRWQLLQKMRDHFWERWSREYLHSLIHRPKWWNKESGFDVGRLCLIRSELTPPTKWPLARIVRIHLGQDGQIRVVTVRTASSELTRPIVKLILLPIADSEAKESSKA